MTDYVIFDEENADETTWSLDSDYERVLVLEHMEREEIDEATIWRGEPGESIKVGVLVR